MTTDNNKGREPDMILTDGALKAASWREDGEYGPYFNTRITRRYTNKEGEVRETNSLRERDLLPAAELAGEVRRSIVERKREQAQDRTQSNEPNKPHTEDWHDDTLTDREIRQQSFKQDRSQPGTRSKRPLPNRRD